MSNASTSGRPLHLESTRLLLSSATTNDLEEMLGVFASNPLFLGRREGTVGVPGHYDLEMLRRDWAIADLDPGRHQLAVRLKATGRLVAVADFIESHPQDDMPWIGMVIVDADDQRARIGTEIVRTLAAELHRAGHRSVRAAVMADDHEAVAFAHHVGFSAFSESEAFSPGGPVPLLLLERDLP